MSSFDPPQSMEWGVDRLEADKMKVLALLLDDPNPIHVDPEAARRLGVGDRAANQGPCNMALVVNMLRSSLPGAKVTELDVRLTGSAFEGDAVDVEGRLVDWDPDRERMVYEVSAWVPDGQRLVEGRAVLDRAT